MLAFIVSFFAKDIVMKFFSEDYYEAIKLIQIMTLIWALHAIIKILNYPILGKFFSTHFINRLTFKFTILHVLVFFVWVNLFDTPLSMSYFFGSVVLIHLLTFVYLVYLKVYLKK